MKSALNKQEFKNRLEELTSKEMDFYFLPFNFSGKPFCGTYNENSFDLTRNSILWNARMWCIRGEYRENETTVTEVSYQISSPKWMNYGMLIFNVLIFIGMWLLIILTSNYHNVKLIITMSGIFVFGNGWVWLVSKITRSLIDQRFQEEFEINVQDEWEQLVPRNKHSAASKNQHQDEEINDNT